MKFYTNIYPVVNYDIQGKEYELPVGSIFQIKSVTTLVVVLKPIDKKLSDEFLSLSPEMLKFAFTESDSI